MEERVPFYGLNNTSHLLSNIKDNSGSWDGLWSAAITPRKLPGYPATASRPVQKVVNRLTRDKRLLDDDWEMLKEVNPLLVSRMILEGKFQISGDPPLEWMSQNFESVYYWIGDVIYIASENDAVALKLKFEG